MSTNRLLVVLAVIALIVTVSFTAQKAFSNANSTYNAKETAPREYELGERYGESPESSAMFRAENIQREFSLGERYGVTPQEYAAATADEIASDFHQRHPDWTWAVEDVKVVIPITGDSAYPDYYQRHPELKVPVETAIDTTDYFFRHPELMAPAASIDLTDYYFRHADR